MFYFMDGQRLLELRAKERNKDISPLEAEELDLLRKLADNVDKQMTEQAKEQKQELEKAAVVGDPLAETKVENNEIEKREADTRQDVRDTNAKKLDKMDVMDGDTEQQQSVIRENKDAKVEAKAEKEGDK